MVMKLQAQNKLHWAENDIWGKEKKNCPHHSPQQRLANCTTWPPCDGSTVLQRSSTVFCDRSEETIPLGLSPWSRRRRASFWNWFLPHNRFSRTWWSNCRLIQSTALWRWSGRNRRENSRCIPRQRREQKSLPVQPCARQWRGQGIWSASRYNHWRKYGCEGFQRKRQKWAGDARPVKCIKR